jgi:hypothetical protein
MIKFGWCLDSIHEGCRSEFTFENKLVECECDCHGRTTDVEETVPETVREETAEEPGS